MDANDVGILDVWDAQATFSSNGKLGTLSFTLHYSAALGKSCINETVHTPICTSSSEGSRCHVLLPGEDTAINRVRRLQRFLGNQQTGTDVLIKRIAVTLPQKKPTSKYEIKMRKISNWPENGSKAKPRLKWYVLSKEDCQTYLQRKSSSAPSLCNRSFFP